MNRRLYRLVFNQHRRMWMAVDESATGMGKDRPGGTRGESVGAGAGAGHVARFALPAMTLAAWLACGLPAQVAAQVAADPNAGAHRPTVVQTANGLQQINITRPSPAGVSTNAFTQFDVPRRGVIVNNSPDIVATQQAGYINGNANLLPGGSARIIVNQVTSTLPSQLRGYLEVAGPRSEVIVANPNGILVDGAGFINTSRATLTTGLPMFGGSGSLDAYRVSGGRIGVEGAGMNASDVGQVDLLARAVSANAALYARQLNVVAGANQVDHATLAAAPIAGSGAAPPVGIDVSQLGGMYADKIRLASSELGVGVSSRGMVAAQAGELTLTSEGRLVLSGSTHASSGLTMKARDGIDNSGVTYGAGAASVETGGVLANNGTLAARHGLAVRAGSVASSGTLGAGVNGDGSVGQGGDLSVTASGALSATGRNVAGANAMLKGGTVSLAGSQTVAHRDVNLHASNGNLDLSGATTLAGGALHALAHGALINDGGELSSQGAATLRAGAVSNQGGRLVAGGPMTVQATSGANNIQGSMQSAGALTVAAAALHNSGGRIEADQLAIAAAGDLINRGGTISQYGQGDTALDAGGWLDNSGGTLATNAQDLKIHAAAIDNSGGKVLHAGTGSLGLSTDGTLRNAAGSMQTNGGLVVRAGAIDNRNGTLYGQTGMAAASDGGFDNGGGSVQTAGDLTVSAGTVLSNTGGTMAANGSHSAMTLSVDSLDNRAGRLVNAGGNATVVKAAGTLTNSGGVLSAKGDTTITAQSLDNSRDGRVTSAGALSVDVERALANRGGTLYGQTRLFLGGGTDVDNRGGTAETAGELAIAAGGMLSNAGGTLYGQRRITSSSAAGFDNAGGDVETNGDLTIDAGGTLNNAGGMLAANGQHSAMAVTATGIDSTGGRLINAGDGVTSVKADGVLTNAGGVLGGNGDTTVAAGELVNTGNGNVVARGALTLNVAQSVYNRGGTLFGEDGLALTAGGGIDNTGGDTQTAGNLAVSAGGAVANAGGTLAANGAHVILTMSAASLDNSGGRIVNAGDGATAIHASGSVANDGGVLGGNGDTTIAAQELLNTGRGNVTAARGLALNVARAVDNRGGTLYGGTALALTQPGASLTNQGGAVLGGQDVILRLASVGNDGGIVRANRDIGIAGALTGSGEMTAGGNLALDVIGDYVNDAANMLRADGNLRVSSSGTLTNTGTLGAGGDLTVGGVNVNNAAGAVLNGIHTMVNAGNAITNAGRIEGDTVQTVSAFLDNTGTVIGHAVELQAGDVANNGAAAIMAATQDLKLHAANSVSNLDGATIYSAGNLQIGRDGARDRSGMLANQTGSLVNRSATIEADGDIDIAARSLSNTRASVVTEAGTPTTTSTRTLKAWLADLPDLELSGHRSITVPQWQWTGSTARISAALMQALRSPITIEVPKEDVANLDTNSKTLSFTKAPIEAYYNRQPKTCNDNDCQPWDAVLKRPLTKNAVQYYEGIEDAGSSFKITFWPDYDPAVHIRPDQIRIRYDLGVDNHDYSEVERTTTTSVSTDRLVNASDPGILRAQGAIRINGDDGAILNQSSTMAAGGDLVRRAIGGSVSDVGTALQQTITSTDTSTLYWHQKAGGNSDTKVVPYPTIPVASTTVTALPAIASANQTVQTTARDVSVTTVDRVGNTVTGRGVSGAGMTNGGVSGGGRSGGGAMGGDGIGEGGCGGCLAGGGATGAPVAGVSGQAVRPQAVGTAQGGIPNLTLPGNGLFRIQPAPSATYLVATDPRFTQYKSFISSDYMLRELGLDPWKVQKRFGDGFYEEKLVRDQVTQLTGRTFLAGYSDQMEEYKALMDNGVAYANAFGLTPGIGLSVEQMQQLTTDIVWLASQDVTLPDGTTQSVVVPKLYLAQSNTVNLNDTGALLTGKNVFVNASGNADNSGRIVGDVATQVLGNSILNRGGIGQSGSNTVVQAALDVVNKGGRIAGKDVVVAAGRDVINETHTLTSVRTLPNGYSASGTGIGALASISSSGTTAVLAGRDIAMAGASVGAGQNAMLAAGRDLNIGTVALGTTQDAASRGGDSYSHDNAVIGAGSHIGAGGSVVAVSGRDATLSGSTIQAGSNASLIAGRDTTVTAVMDTHTHSEGSLGGKGAQYTQSSYDETARGSSIQAGHHATLGAGQGALVASVLDGSGITPATDASGGAAGSGSLALLGSTVTTGVDGEGGGTARLVAAGDLTVGTVDESHNAESWSESRRSGFLSKEQTTRTSSGQASIAVGSTVSANAIAGQAGRDLTVSGSNMVATDDVTLRADKDLTIEAAQRTASNNASQETRKSGMFSGGGMAVTFGKQQTNQTQSARSTTHTGSMVGSLGGDIHLSAGEAYTQTGSGVTALQGDIDIAAKRVDIHAAVDTAGFDQETHFRQSGLTIGVSNPVITAMQTAAQMGRAQSQSDDPRMKALAGGATALAATSAADTVQADPEAGGGLSISITVGGAKSDSKQTQTSSTAVGSMVKAGGDVRIKAEGAGQHSNINVVGSDIRAGNDVLMKADNEVNLTAAANTAEQHSSTKSKSGGVGVAISLGSNGMAFGVTANAATARGNADGDDVTWTNSHADAGNKVVIESGGDTNLHGAVVSGKQVIADVGGDLRIESLQDTSTYRSKDESASGSVTVGYGFSGSASVGKQRIDSNFASVTEQSGIQAGDNGFRVEVKGNTDLKGGVIASTDKAMLDGKNRFQTADLTLSDVDNRAEYNADGFGVSVGPAAGAGVGNDSGTARGTTKSGISGIAGHSAVRTGDAPSGISKIFDADKVQKEINAQVQITRALGQEAGRAVDTYVAKSRAELRMQLKDAENDQERAELQRKLDELTAQERVMNILIGAVTGSGAAAVTKEGLSMAADEMRMLMIEDSARFAGVTDGVATYDNLSGESEGVRGDGWKLGGTRWDLDKLCGPETSRCQVKVDANGAAILDADGKKQLLLNDKGQVQFDAKAAKMTLDEFLETKDGKELSGPTGGIQGAKGTLFGIAYEPGSWQDKLIESFAGTHDMIGGKLSGLYDEEGNAGRGRSATIARTQDIWSATGAIAVSSPFGMAEFLPPQLWNAISIFIKAAK